MAIRAKTLITLTQERQVTTVRNFYKATSTNTKPSAVLSSSISDWISQGWLTAEPAYNVSTPYVWLCMQTLFGEYNAITNPNNYINSEVSLSSSYTAAINANILAESIATNTASFWTRYTDTHDKNDSTIPILAGAYASSNPQVDYLDTSTFNYNSYFGANALTFRYKTLNLAKYATNGVQIYKVATGTTYKLSTDVTVDNSKTYYVYSNNVFTKVDLPTGNPSTNNYYEAIATLSQSNPVIELTYDIIDINGTPNIKNRLTFYDPETNYKSMELRDSELAFYLPNTGATKAASLTSTGLVLSKGGIESGSLSSGNGYVYLSTEDYPLREFILTEDQAIDNTKIYYQFDSNSQTYLEVEEPDVSEINTYYELTEAGIPINNYTPTKGDNNLGTISNPAWRQVIGTKFGVDSEGNLYASGANINGAITATSLTIQSNGNNYDGMAAINISGYDITIEIYNDENESDPDNYTYLIPHMYHNGENIDNTITDKTDFIWYRDDSSIGTAGAIVDGGIRAYRGSTYRVIYEFEDGAVGDSTTIQDRYLYPTEYITDITDAGIKVHPKEWLTDSNYLQIDGNGIYVKNSNDIELAHFTGTNAQIGKTSSNNVFIDENSLDIRKGADTFATFSTTGVQIGKNSGMHSKMTASSMTFYGVQNEPIALLAYIPSPTLDRGSAFYTFGTRPSGCLVGTWSFAEGENVIASGVDSHAEGCNTQATGHYSHAEGCDTQANGLYSHAQNNGTIASKTSQTVIGKFNQEDTESISAKTKAFIIGNGANENNRSNAFTIDFSGNVVASGEIMDGNGNTVSKAYCYVNSVTSTTITTASTNTQVPITSINSTNSFTYDSTTNGIKCNKSGRYLVSCGLYASTATSGDLMGVSVTKNDGASTCGPQYQRAGGNNETIMLMPTPIQLAEGDILTILGRNNTSARGTFTSCRFSVWEI